VIRHAHAHGHAAPLRRLHDLRHARLKSGVELPDARRDD